jgi:hypothetical protein
MSARAGTSKRGSVESKSIAVSRADFVRGALETDWVCLLHLDGKCHLLGRPLLALFAVKDKLCEPPDAVGSPGDIVDGKAVDGTEYRPPAALAQPALLTADGDELADGRLEVGNRRARLEEEARLDDGRQAKEPGKEQVADLLPLDRDGNVREAEDDRDDLLGRDCVKPGQELGEPDRRSDGATGGGDSVSKLGIESPLRAARKARRELAAEEVRDGPR